MGKITKKENLRLEIEPFDNTAFSWQKQPNFTEQYDELDRIKRDIHRHIDDVGYISIKYDSNEYCEFCGSIWTETTPYNQCCDKDVELMDNVLSNNK